MANLPQDIVPADYPELAKLVWNRDSLCAIPAEEAFTLYERYWRHVDRATLSVSEAQLISVLVATLGNGVMLVD